MQIQIKKALLEGYTPEDIVDLNILYPDENFIGTNYGKIGLGTYLTHKGITTILPKTLGIRTEYHTTSKDNAKKILNTGYLDPSYGGTGGASEKIKSGQYINNSKNFVHITGNVKSSGSSIKDRINSNLQNVMYKAVHNLDTDKRVSGKEFGKGLFKSIIPGIDNSKTLIVMQPKSYFNRDRFSPDHDSGGEAMKTKEKVPVYSNKYSALYDQIKQKITNRKNNANRN